MKIIKIAGVVFLVLLLSAAGLIWYKLHAPVPAYQGKIELQGIQDTTIVHFDSYGVPHISAKNAIDAYTTLGYVHASERLFQMEILKRLASGRLSEVLGAELIETDKFFRALGIHQKAKSTAAKIFKHPDAPEVRLAKAYLNGINKFIETGPAPLEFDILGIDKSPFIEEDLFLVVGYMALGFADGFKVDPLIMKIHQDLGPEYLECLDLHYKKGSKTIPSHSPKIELDSLITQLSVALHHIPSVLMEGSNGIVVGPSKSSNGHVLLENDTHIGFSQPAVWYEAHLKYPGQNIYGHYAAGFPFAILGHNQHLGWGITMFENDDVDFFIEKVDWENKTYQFKDQQLPLKSTAETIRIKGQDSLAMEVFSTHHGPIINEVFKDISNENTVAVWWAYTQLEAQFLEAAYGMNTAKNKDSFQSSIALINAPGLNIMYGDVAGNIAWWATAKVPIRPFNVDPKLFLMGFSGKHEYNGFYSFKDNPHSVNPPEGYIITANNQPDSVNGVFFHGYYRPEDRAIRLQKRLDEQEKWDTDLLKQTSLDHHSDAAVEICKEIVSVLQNDSTFNKFKPILETWDGNHKKNSIAPGIYYTFLTYVFYYAMKDELGATNYLEMATSPLLRRSYLTLLSNPDAVWWDNINTNKKEKRSDIFLQAVLRMDLELTRHYGANTEDWLWSKMHLLTHEHPLGKVELLAPFFNVGPFAVDGGNEVPNNLKFKLDTTGIYKVNAGAAVRRVLDFSDLNNSWNVLPTGQSGHKMSPYYDDQAALFNDGLWRAQTMDKKIITTFEQKLAFIPVQK